MDLVGAELLRFRKREANQGLGSLERHVHRRTSALALTGRSGQSLDEDFG